MSLNQFFGYFGSKHRLSRRYPKPLHDTIIEPFAGSAGYATHYHFHRVVLVEKNPVVAALWRYLIGASVRDIMALPELEPDQSTADLQVCDEARALIGFWLGHGDEVPRNRRSPLKASWLAKNQDSWCPAVRARIAGQVSKIRHWQLIDGSYELAPDVEASWFIDPPYEVAGERYPCGAKGIDFAALGAWCRSRRGQVMVCENEGASWLPFRAFRNVQAVSNGVSKEVIWTNDATRTQATA